MSQHNFNIADENGTLFLADVNNALQALASLSAGTAAPTTTYAYQPWYDTTNAVFKIRNAANSAWVTVGPIADSTTWAAYVGNAIAMSINSSKDVSCAGTGAIKVPVGTTAQRPTVAQGQIRYNTDLAQFEGYNGTSWGTIGGGGNITVDTFSGNGSTTGFTLSVTPGATNNTFVFISGVYQQKSTYSVSGTTITFTTAPPTGTNNIQVVSGTSLSIGTPSDGTVTQAKMAFSPLNQINVQRITSTGTYTPTSGMKYAIVEVQGGGGGGGATGGGGGVGSGGGAGGYARVLLTSAQAGVSQTITINSGGGSGAAGGTVSFGALISCTGGSAGNTSTTSAINQGGSGGSPTVSTGTVIFSSAGQTGGIGYNSSGAQVYSGFGANSLFGTGGNSVLSNGVGSNASGNGSGGSGAFGTGPFSAGSGTNGIVVVTEFIFA